MFDQFDPYYTAVRCSEQGFPVRPVTPFRNPTDIAEASSDPIFNHERWSGAYKGYAVELPTGTTSGTLAVRITRPSNDNHCSGFPALFDLEARYGALIATTFYEDAAYWTLIYGCTDGVIIHGAVSIAPGITLHGNGSAVILPPYELPGLIGTAAFAHGYGLSHDVLVMAPNWLIKKATRTGLMQKSQQCPLEDVLLQDLAA